MTFRPTLPIIALALLGGACSASSDSAVQSTAPIITATTIAAATTTTTVPASGDVVTFESEPIDAGPLFGSATEADAQTSAGSNDTSSEPSDDDIAPFVRAPADEPFCTLLDDMNERPFPSDEAEVFVVVQSWITELRTLAPEPIIGHLDTMLAFLDEAISSQGQITIEDSADIVDDAADGINAYVDAKCLGLGIAAVSEPVDPPATTSASEAALDFEIPVITFDEDQSGNPTPYFGEDLDVGSGGAVDPEIAPFCFAIHVINNRPQPTTDDTAEIRVGKAYFKAIASAIPSELTDEFAVINEWIDGVLAVGSFDDVAEPEPGDDISTAVDAVNTFVDDQCLTA